MAVDATNGHTLWPRRITDTKSAGVDIQPTVADGIVIASTVPISVGGIYQGGDRGTIVALDARTGAVRWKFATVPKRPTAGTGAAARLAAVHAATVRT